VDIINEDQERLILFTKNTSLSETDKKNNIEFLSDLKSFGIISPVTQFFLVLILAFVFIILLTLIVN
jgi:hypothetical protein